MIGHIHKAGRAALSLLSRPLAKAFDNANNPLNHLGAMTVFFLWIVLISGIWLFIFFRTSVSGAFDSVEYLTREQWYLGGVMRSLHRYASDAAILTIVLHILREFVFDRYRHGRWFTWVTGLPLVWMIFPLGITGYWLVWDELAQYVAITSAELIDRIPIFTDSMAANFLSDELLSDRFFTLLAFLHLIGLPIFLVFGVWLHVFRLDAPHITPPRRLMAGTLMALLVVSFLVPAISHERAELAMVPETLQLDWFYLHLYPLTQVWSPGWVWVLLVGISGFMVVLPWTPSKKQQKPAVVTLDYCNGCERCVNDCPFGAVEMVPRTDGTNYTHQAEVDADLCASCGICVGSCPTATPFRRSGVLLPGIDMPDRSAALLREEIMAAPSDGETAKILVFACQSDERIPEFKSAGHHVVAVNCVAQVQPSFLDFALSRGHADGIFLPGCRDGNCQYRFGTDWTEQRLSRTRDPMLRQRVDLSKIALGWQAPWGDYASDLKKIEALQRSIVK